MEFIRIGRDARPEWSERIAGLEAFASYPLGADRFKLDHGQDYFAFFDRLGEVEYWVAVEDENVAAVGCGVLRKVPVGQRALKAWYLGDLKVHPGYRGLRLPLRLLGEAFPRNYLRARRGYAITMNPERGPNRVVPLLARFRWARVAPPVKLLLYSLDERRMTELASAIETHRGPIHFLSLCGKKDLVLQSTGNPMQLLHVQFGPCAEPVSSAEAFKEPQAGFIHMFCAPEGDELARAVAAAGVDPSATATILHHRMGRSDWRFVLTSDI